MPSLKVEREYYTLDGYEVLSHYSTDEEIYVSEIAALPGCATDGETRQESLDALVALKGEWISEMSEMGKSLPAPKFKPGSVLA